MFQNPISRPSCQKWRKTITTQKVLVTQSSNIMHCDWHTRNLYVQIFKPLWTLFPCWIWCFFIFCQGEFRNAWMSVWPTVSPNVMMTWQSTALDHQMPIPGVQFLKNYNFRQTFHILLILTEKCFFSFLSRGVKETAKNFTFCWFWLGEMSSKLLEWYVLRVWGMPNPMSQVLSLCDKQFLKNHNFRQTFHILLILTEKNALKLLEWCVFRVQGVPNPMALVLSLYDM